MAANIIISERRMQEFIKKGENDKISELIDKYDRKLLTVKKKKYIISIVEVVIDARSTLSSQIIIEKRMEDLI